MESSPARPRRSYRPDNSKKSRREEKKMEKEGVDSKLVHFAIIVELSLCRSRERHVERKGKKQARESGQLVTDLTRGDVGDRN